MDRIAVNAAGCGSAMKEYGELFADDPAWADARAAISAKVRDVTELLVELGEQRAIRRPLAARVVYHDACHLAHGQGVRAQPRALLQGIPGIELLTPAESEICCGSAGIYNLVQPGAGRAARSAQSPSHRGAVAGYDCHGQPRVHAADRGRGPRSRARLADFPPHRTDRRLDSRRRSADDGRW